MISQVLEEFADAILQNKTIEKSLCAIYPLDISTESIFLENGICIRPITEEELWEFGDIESWFMRIREIPYWDWKILDMEIVNIINRDSPTEAIEMAVLVALQLASSGSFHLKHLGWTANYGYGFTTISTIEKKVLRGRPYVINGEVAQCLKSSWSGIRRIVESRDHYLRLPAQRLVDGGARVRDDDAIIDYAIGLEALLTEGVEGELRYRFALRGATILAWNGGDRKKFFSELRDFYDMRSSIVHGGNVSQTRLEEFRVLGDNILRNVWWWYFENGTSGLENTTRAIDRRILSCGGR